ncbi:MAG: FAD-binding protein, partial [Gammaproteobacteria bacterium]|nr:FAD-binding protein [Gammaproteobacteria bacterium]
ALNARTLQLLEVVNLFDELYPLGKQCNTSSVWANGDFISRQSHWWESLKGCFHKHFLMLGQSFVEQLLDRKLTQEGASVVRNSEAIDIELQADKCVTTLANGDLIESKFIIGADGSHSLVREKLGIVFEITRPQIIWAVLDAEIITDFPKVPEIITFQAETSDVAWIPREGNIDRFYIQMETKEFSVDDALAKINRAMAPHSVTIKTLEWFSSFSVKESVAESYAVEDRAFLAGDACHIHSVNGGQGLNTGIADAFNLIWKLAMVTQYNAPIELLRSYETERKTVAKDVVETSGQLVRSTKFSEAGTHAQDYVKIVERRSGYITGMGIQYQSEGLKGQRFYDLEIHNGLQTTRLYSLLNYQTYSLLIFGNDATDFSLPPYITKVSIADNKQSSGYWADNSPYTNQAILVRPDAYIVDSAPLEEIDSLIDKLWQFN